MADRGGLHASSVSNGLICRTSDPTHSESKQQIPGLTNLEFETSAELKDVLDQISRLDEYDLDFLAYEIAPDDCVDQVQTHLLEFSLHHEPRPQNTQAFIEAAIEYRQSRGTVQVEISGPSIPEFDDPDFSAKLHMDSTPLNERKQFFVRLWESFDRTDRIAFLRKIDPNGAFYMGAA